MPPKQKPKKGAFTDAKIQSTIDLIKAFWPDYAVSVANIRNPTRDFVLKFYSDCVANLDVKCANIAKTDNSPTYCPGLSEEELLFLKLSRIPSLTDMGFRLGDLYTFDSKRLDSHILLIMHFLNFTEQTMNQAKGICNKVFDAQDKMQRDHEEIQRLKEAYIEKQQELTSARSKNKSLNQIAEIVEPQYSETMLLIEETEKKCKNSVEDIKELEININQLQEEITKLESTEHQLKQQVVTEEEYADLKEKLNELIKEECNLEDSEDNNDLLKLKQNVELLQTCCHKLDLLELPSDILNLAQLRADLKDEQQNVDHLVEMQHKNEANVNTLKDALENEKAIVNLKSVELQEMLKNSMEKELLLESAERGKLQAILKDVEALETEARKKVSKREADSQKLAIGMQQRLRRLMDIYEAGPLALQTLMDKNVE